jgi:transposase InsO family protein
MDPGECHKRPERRDYDGAVAMQNGFESRWRTFLRNHAPDIAAMDLFVVPTIGFDLLFAFVIVRLGRRQLVWINVTATPTAEWIARQITEAFPWEKAPRYLIRDRDRIYGRVVTRRLRAMGIRDKPTAPGSPWQNGFVERLIGSIRRECVDQCARLSWCDPAGESPAQVRP